MFRQKFEPFLFGSRKSSRIFFQNVILCVNVAENLKTSHVLEREHVKILDRMRVKI